MKKILVTGSNGQLGRELQALAGQHPAFEFVFADRSVLPIEDQQAINDLFTAHQPAWCINCAAYTAVDKAESDKENAFRINGEAPGWLANACRNAGALLIHISTDYVFPGNSPAPLKENDTTGPINVYGASKLEGERRALEQYPDGTLIIRTSWVYSEYGNNFVKTMIRLMTERPAISVVDDQLGSPTYAADLAAAILHIVDAPRFIPGIFHYSNEGRISWYEFALAIRDKIGSTCTVNPIPTSGFPTPATRPHYSLLDKTLIRHTYGLTIPRWESSLDTCLRRYGIVPPTAG
ncbi:MAG TPA: dTDP-4-dehydrorhamnose reductase [Puia sp.]|nr:dTDP-4-dehydrorhamnose reductase [Puia sp.]